MAYEVILGIDLGTTFSTAAYVDESGEPIAIPNADGKLTTPSVVYIKEGEIVVGEPALNHWVSDQEHVIRWVKRAMGRKDFNFLGFNAVEISAEILKQLKVDAEAYLQAELRKAVITCPAYFAALEIENTKKAGEFAGFQIKEIIKEPTAAAVYYGVENMQDGEKVLVCDLGGGTYDATLLAYQNGIFTPLASDGDRKLGGHDWTMDLVGIVSDRFLFEFGEDPNTDLVAAQVLYEDCERAKRDFARHERVTIPCSYHGLRGVYTITRDEFEETTEFRIQKLIMYSDAALVKAQMKWSDLDAILLVGGSSRLRRMGLALHEASGIKPVQSNKPDLAVALGAAVLAKGQVRRRKSMTDGLVDASGGGLIEVVYERIIARSLGTRAIVFDQHNHPTISNSLIIPHSTKAPVTLSREDFEISVNDQETFEIPVVEFENDFDYDPVDNFCFTCLPDARNGDRIRVTFHYDESGIPKVEAVDVKTGAALKGERKEYEEPDPTLIVRVRPRWVVFAIDVSWSMEGAKLKSAREALIDNARQLLERPGGECQVGIVSFSSTAKIVCEPTNDLNRVMAAARSLTAESLTSMDEGIDLAIQIVSRAPEGTDRDVVMLTDGMPDESRKQTTVQAAQRAGKKNITLSSIGVGKQDVDLDFLQSLTKNALVIEVTGNMGEAMGRLLTQSAKARGGLIEKGSALTEN